MRDKTNNRILGAAVAVMVMLCVAATVTTKYRGTFIGDGSQLTGITGATGSTATTLAAGATIGAANGAALTNLTAGNIAGVSWITNTVVSGVVTNGDGSITVTTTNLSYLGKRP